MIYNIIIIVVRVMNECYNKLDNKNNNNMLNR